MSNSNSWSSWKSIDSKPVKYRYRRGDDLDGGNFAWEFQIRNDDFAIIRLSYKIEIKKGDGTPQIIEDSTDLGPGSIESGKVSAASVVRIIVIDITRL